MINRIFQLMSELNLTATEFANELGISKAVLSSIKTGRTQPSLQIVEKIKGRYPNVSFNWLIFGDGNMFEGESNEYMNQEESSERDLFTRFESFDDETTAIDTNYSIEDTTKQQIYEDNRQIKRPIDTQEREYPPTNINIRQSSNGQTKSHIETRERNTAKDYKKGSGRYQRNEIKSEPIDKLLLNDEVPVEYMPSQKFKRTVRKIVVYYTDNTYEEFYKEMT